MDSLPQIRNLLEMREISSAAKVSGGVKDEVNDERKKAHRGGHSRAVSAGAEEREDGNSERVCGVERVRAQLCGAGFAQSRSGGASETAAADSSETPAAHPATRPPPDRPKTPLVPRHSEHRHPRVGRTYRGRCHGA